jgi:hypothetical protein
MKALIVLLALFFVLFCGCAQYQPPKTYSIVKEKIYDKPYIEIWDRVIEWFALNGSPIKNMDKESGFIATEYSLSTGQMQCLDCGTPGQALYIVQRLENPRGNFNILVKKQDNGTTKVMVNCFFKVTSNVYSDGRVIQTDERDCNSTGKLENEIFDYIGAGSTAAN